MNITDNSAPGVDMYEVSVTVKLKTSIFAKDHDEAINEVKEQLIKEGWRNPQIEYSHTSVIK